MSVVEVLSRETSPKVGPYPFQVPVGDVGHRRAPHFLWDPCHGGLRDITLIG